MSAGPERGADVRAGAAPAVPAVPADSTASLAPAAPPLAATLARVVVWSLIVGLALEALLLAARALAGSLPGWVAIAAETVQKSSWSMLLCAAIAAGQTLGRVLPRAMGLAGLVAAPLALVAARAMHKGTLQALGATPPAGGSSSEVVVAAAIKAVEYGIFGVVIGRIASRGETRVARYLVPAAVLGLATAAVIALRSGARGLPLALIAINELFFPIGCAFVLYVASRATSLVRGR